MLARKKCQRVVTSVLNFVRYSQRIKNTGQKLVEHVPLVGQYAGATKAQSEAARLVAHWKLQELKFVDTPFDSLKAKDIEVSSKHLLHSRNDGSVR